MADFMKRLRAAWRVLKGMPPPGHALTDIIVRAVAEDVAKGGRAARALEANYGLRRPGVERGAHRG